MSSVAKSAIGYFGGVCAAAWLAAFGLHLAGGTEVLMNAWWGMPAILTTFFGIFGFGFYCSDLAEKL